MKAADAVIFGSPIYFMNLTAQMQAFLERFFFSQYIYSREIPSVLGKKMPSAFLYTMNATEEQMEQFHLKESLATYEWAAASKKACPACFFLFMRFPSFPSIVLHSPDFFQSVKKQGTLLLQHPLAKHVHYGSMGPISISSIFPFSISKIRPTPGRPSAL